MNIVVPTGYMGSGSSAITDILTEIEGYSAPNNSFEYIFLHCPNGVFDLEDKLLLGNNAIRSDEAIRAFLTAMGELYNKKDYWPGRYDKYVSEHFMTYCEEFIADISIGRLSNAVWYYQQNPTSIRMKVWDFLRRLIEVITKGKIILDWALLDDKMYYAYPTSEVFYQAATEYINKILADIKDKILQKDKIVRDNIILDQFLLPHNLFRINNYFDEKLKVIVVERDPRDVFLLNKYYWVKQNSNVPYPADVKMFCKIYKGIRESEKVIERNNILRLKFEDCIYNYEKMLDVLYDFLNIKPSNHVNKGGKFIPKKSICNTQIYNRNPQFLDEAKYIEKELGMYLYNYPYIIDENNGDVF